MTVLLIVVAPDFPVVNHLLVADNSDRLTPFLLATLNIKILLLLVYPQNYIHFTVHTTSVICAICFSI